MAGCGRTLMQDLMQRLPTRPSSVGVDLAHLLIMVVACTTDIDLTNVPIHSTSHKLLLYRLNSFPARATYSYYNIYGFNQSSEFLQS